MLRTPKLFSEKKFNTFGFPLSVSFKFLYNFNLLYISSELKCVPSKISNLNINNKKKLKN